MSSHEGSHPPCVQCRIFDAIISHILPKIARNDAEVIHFRAENNTFTIHNDVWLRLLHILGEDGEDDGEGGLFLLNSELAP